MSKKTIIENIGAMLLFLHRTNKENGVKHRNDPIRSMLARRMGELQEFLLEDNKPDLEDNLLQQRDKLVELWIQLVDCDESEPPTHYYGYHTDYRMLGDDASEVSTLIEWKCCEECTHIARTFQANHERAMRSFTGRSATYPVNGRLEGADISHSPICAECDNCSIARGTTPKKGIDFWVCLDCNLQYRDISGLEKEEKIIQYRERSYSESLDSDEMRINVEWLD